MASRSNTGVLGLQRRNSLKNYFRKPENILLVVLGILLTLATIVPIVSIIADTISVHPGSIDARKAKGATWTFFNWKDLFRGNLRYKNFWIPFRNTMSLAVATCVVALSYGGVFAYLITRSNMAIKKYLSAIFVFPYIMPQWTLAVVWQNLFNSRQVTGGSDGLLATLLGIYLPEWWCKGLFPSALVLGFHYAAFAYILIGGIFKNMDANLEEAASILNASKSKIFFRITLPLVKPAMISTILLVFSSAMGSYPVPHYLGYTTLSTKYVGMSVNRAGQASILAVIMMLCGVLILLVNQRSMSGRKNYTTVTGKSGQSSLVNLGRLGRHVIAAIFVVLTFVTSIFPILSFTVETFLPNPGDYSFLSTGNFSNLTTKWWVTNENLSENGMYGQLGILYNSTIWNAFKGTVFVSLVAALLAGTIGLLVGYAVSKKRRSRFAAYVNSIAFLPYLMPALAVGVSFFVIGNQLGIYNTYLLVIIAGTIKYIPFASRSSLNSMMQISAEIEEAAVIQGIPWRKRMLRILIPIQKAAILSGFLLPFMTAIRELTLFMLLCTQNKLLTTLLDYFDEMGLYAFSSGINLILIVFIIICNSVVNRLTGASLDNGIGGN
ncbi:MAG: iron ABC transporter permease [Eubacteriales bacterium]|nr:iron ABC transporter permease [Eubacteriales bacterium]